ncbi:pilus assembly protein TadG-related protein [Streptomyces sp. Ru87]|uniref:pilus assembly protein TadG-related protein n=1 Tax=Streptomyces sp. Ru87 TaxID=2044307 RepID=UPI00269BE553|nr:pilus assembly protein TadG-related protein [Streptomyces sp. Ru87]
MIRSIRSRFRVDSGQAFPIYITVVAGLLFLAFAYFAVGQAAATRNGAQTAADAAALAAAQHSRDELFDGFLDAVEDDGPWEDWLSGDEFSTDGGCAAADDFAARNDSTVTRCGLADTSEYGFSVAIRTDYTVGESIVPGTESVHGEADATAVVEPRCQVDEGGGGEPVEISCDGEEWLIDPDDEEALPEPADLFSVHLTD